MDEKILVVEDDRQTRELLIARLSEAGYDVISTPRGDRAIQMALRERPDLVILDIVLEGAINGYSVARSLNSLDETSSTYIIFLSTKREVKDRVRGFATGAHDFISKEHFSTEEFIARVENGIRIKKTHDALRDRSNIDGLSGLFNHRFFMEELMKEMEKSHRHGFTLTLAFIDVDNFKQFNDQFGHYAGDRVLSKISRIIKTSCRSTDICARYGGEEFTVILPTTDTQGSQIVMERVRSTIESALFTVRGSGADVEYQKVTVSIGIAAYSSGMTAPEFIELADKKAMYRAKAAGKNRIYIFLGYDEQGNEIVIDAAGRRPSQVDLSAFRARLMELEARIRNLDSEQLLQLMRQVYESIDTLEEGLALYYREQQDLEERQEGDGTSCGDGH